MENIKQGKVRHIIAINDAFRVKGITYAVRVKKNFPQSIFTQAIKRNLKNNFIKKHTGNTELERYFLIDNE